MDFPSQYFSPNQHQLQQQPPYFYPQPHGDSRNNVYHNWPINTNQPQYQQQPILSNVGLVSFFQCLIAPE